ncbi:uncharacterized protein LOC143187681 [Calliopsis andreniformis]|uniref:uncharacterized protein LOC143187681 n=1 Tax=Calliopsis andreniformis TaxID=337506 RepID=UPI003FCCF269
MGKEKAGGKREGMGEDQIGKRPLIMSLRFIQINLHHSEAASAALVRTMARDRIDVALIQELWTAHGGIRGLGLVGKVWALNNKQARACILTRKGLDISTVRQYNARDMAVVSVGMKDEEEQEDKTIYVVSVYAPWNAKEEKPGTAVQKFMEFAQDKGVEVLIGGDMNAKHKRWGSTITNTKAEELMEFILANGLVTLNRGNRHTFETVTRKEVLDVTMCSQSIAGKLKGWRVSSDISFSDHKYIRFEVNAGQQQEILMRRNPRATN